MNEARSSIWFDLVRNAPTICEGSFAHRVYRNTGLIFRGPYCFCMPTPAVMPLVDGLEPFKFPESRNEGPPSTNGLILDCDRKLYFASNGNCQVRIVNSDRDSLGGCPTSTTKLTWSARNGLYSPFTSTESRLYAASSKTSPPMYPCRSLILSDARVAATPPVKGVPPIKPNRKRLEPTFQDSTCVA